MSRLPITRPEDWRTNRRRKTVTHASGVVFVIRPEPLRRDRRPMAVPQDFNAVPDAWLKHLPRIAAEALAAFLEAERAAA